MARKLQEIWQTHLPLRPQSVYIIGTNPIARPIVNAITAIAALFVNQKVNLCCILRESDLVLTEDCLLLTLYQVISRMKHVNTRTLGAIIGPENLPPEHGGIQHIPTDQWVSSRHLISYDM